jgi:hypothetical protein
VVFHNNCWNFSEHGWYMNGESLCVMCEKSLLLHFYELCFSISGENASHRQISLYYPKFIVH